MDIVENDRTPLIAISTSALAAAIERLFDEDAVAVPFLSREWRARLLDEARTLSFRRARPTVGEGDRTVRQDFDICMTIPDESSLHELRRTTALMLDAALAMIDPCPLDHALRFNDIVVQRYRSGSSGISPHRDHLRYVDLVALLPLSGESRFYVCTSRSGMGARDVPSHPGDLILMRAPGFCGRKDRPFHGVSDIEGERYSVGLRHDATKVDREAI